MLVMIISGFDLPLNLLPDLHRRVLHLIALVPAQVQLLEPQGLSFIRQLRDRVEVEVARKVPEESARYPDERPVGELAPPPLDGLDRLVVDDDLVVARLDEPARDVLELLARLDEEVVAGRDLDGYALARVARPDVQARVARAPVDGEEVQVRVEPGQDGVLLPVFDEV